MLCIALIVGTALSRPCPTAPLVYALAGLLAAFVASVLSTSRRVSEVALALALTLAGLAYGQYRQTYVPPHDLRLAIGTDPVLTRLRLVILEPPTTRPAEYPAHQSTTATTAQVLAVESGATWQPCSGKLLIRISGSAPPLSPQMTIQAIGMLSRIGPPDNPGTYDWQEHFAQEGIALRFHVDDGRGVLVIGNPGEGPLWRCRRTVREALAAGFSSTQQLDLATLRALLLGDNDDRLEQTWADFRASGTAHHLSISGMHIAIFAGVMSLIARSLMLSPRKSVLLILLLVLTYAAMTRSSPPVVRSVLLCCAIAAARLLRRNTDPVQCLAVGVTAMLLWNPLDLWNPGFQLSAGTVAALMLWASRLNSWILSFENEHKRMARLIRPPTGWAAFVYRIRSWTIQALCAGFIAHLVTLPLVAWHFNQLNSWAILCSILLAPFVTAALIAALLKTLICLLLPATGPLLAGMAAFPSALMRQSVGTMAHWPGAQCALPPLPWWALLLYAAVALLPLLPVIRTWRFRWLGPAAAMLLGLLLPLWTTLLANRATDSLRLTILSVGNGSTMLLELPHHHAALIDCGSMLQSRLFESVLQPVLRQRNISQIETVLLTHDDRDHTSALREVEAAFSPRICHSLLRGDVPLDTEGCRIEALAPESVFALSSNDASAVLKLTFAGRTILFTGDIEDLSIRRLLVSQPDLAADVLIAPHHGSCVPSTPRLLNAVHPSLVIASSAPTSTGRQRQFDQLCQSRILLRTGNCGAITVTISPVGELNVTTHRP